MKYDFYVVVTDKRGPDGGLLSQPWNTFEWYRGVINRPLTFIEATRVAAVVGGRIEKFYTIDSKEVEEWIRNTYKLPEVTKHIDDFGYKDKLKEMSRAKFHWSEYTEGDRSSKAVDGAFRHCIDNNLLKCEVQL